MRLLFLSNFFDIFIILTTYSTTYFNMQKFADISTYNFQNQPLVLGMIIFGIVAMLASLVITIRELPKAEYPQ